MRLEKVYYKETIITFSWQFVLFCFIFLAGGAAIRAFENQNLPPSTTSKVSKVSIIENFSKFHNVSDTKVKDLLDKLEKLEKKAEKMNYPDSLALTLSLFYTIGWGHVTPVTVGGKIVTMLTSIVGIPLTVIMVITGGKLMLKILDDVIIKISCLCSKRRQFNNNNKKHLSRKKEVIAACVIAIASWFIGAGITSMFKKISYFDGLWYCFITFTTVGLGDIYPNSPVVGKEGMIFFLFAWLLVGFASMCMLVLVAVKFDPFRKTKWRMPSSMLYEKKKENELLLENTENRNE